MPYWIAIHEGDIPLQTKFLDKNDPIFRKWEQWLLNEGGKILNDPTGIARWFGGLCLKHHEKRHPLSLHGEDFMRLMKIQKPVDERICEAVFGDPAFEHIERAVLHKGYVECCKDDGQKRPLKQAKFYERVREWMEHHNMKRSEEGKPELIEAQLRVFQRSLEKEVRPRVWIPADKVQVGGTEQKRHNSTRHLYLADQGYKTIWVGPELGAEG